MDTENKASLATELSKKVRSLSLDKAALRRLLELLQERSFGAGDIEVANFKQLQQTPEIFEENKKKLKEGFRFYITLKGGEGKSLNGAIDAIFDSPNFPDLVKSVFLDSANPLKFSDNYTPRNSMALFLDFTRPDVLNFSFQPSQETPNSSNIVIRGSDSTWVHGVFHEFEGFMNDYPSTAGWLHKHSIYDVFVWVLGLPLGFWGCFRLSEFLNAHILSGFLKNAAYVYIFFATLLAFRILFHYSRWIWPLVEFRGERNHALKHRIIISAISLGVISSVIYDIIKLIWDSL